ncbi:MAG: hypothetical protein KBD14_01725 [Candidatus Pacebacteria bacterium]|nr:hypothetical protein [Candidatus Paceibacterota bacterium]
MTTKSITSAQTDKVADLGREAVKTAVGKVNPTSTDAQNGIIGNGGEFKSRVEKAVEAIIMEMTTPNKYANEVVSSNYTYPKEYKGPKPIAEQVKIIATMFGLDPTQALQFAKNLPAFDTFVPSDCPDIGWFAIPKVSAVAKQFSSITEQALQYCEAVNLVHTKLADSRSFTNYRNGEIVPSKLRQHARTASFLEHLEAEQVGDILIIAAQYGMFHRGKSINRARETFAWNEFGLGEFHVCCMALVHPERYVHWQELETDCPGDEFSPDGDGVFSDAPYLVFGGNGLGFGVGDVSYFEEIYGSVSGFVPQN